MTESSPTPVFYGSAKAEQAKVPKKESKIVTGVKKAIDAWLERIGPKSVENHFVKAHEKVLATLNSDERKEVFAKEADKWRKQGKMVGVAATTIDATLTGIGIGISIIGLRNPNMALAQATALPYLIIPRRFAQNYFTFLQKAYQVISPFSGDELSIAANRDRNNRGLRIAATSAALIPTLGSLGILLGSGPGHWLAHLAAGGKEQIGKMKARTNNYVDSGKAAEHAAKVGNAIGKAATETAKYVAEHPDEIRKTVETVSRVKRQNAESAQKLAEAKQKAADIALEKEYQDWVSHHPDKAYYEQSGTPYPSKAEYTAKKQEEAAKKKANKEVEERGIAKH